MKLKRKIRVHSHGFLQGALFFLLCLMPACGGIVPASGPKVVSSSPSDENNTDFPLNRGLSVTFNKTMNAETLNEKTFFLHEAGIPTAIPARIATDGITARLKPLSNLKFSTSYVFTVNRGATDKAGNALSEVFAQRLTTLAAPAPGPVPDPGAGLDTEAPRILSVSPSNGASDVRLDSIITVLFSEPVDPATLTAETFDLSKGAQAKNLFLSGQMAVFEPEADLRPDEHYNVTITTGIKDLAGNALASDFIWTFSTEDDDEDEEDFN